MAYATTEDTEYYLHPESLVRTMSFADASKSRDRFLAIESFHRDAGELTRQLNAVKAARRLQ